MLIDITVQTENFTVHIYNEESDFLPVIDVITNNDETLNFFLYEKDGKQTEDLETLKVIEKFQDFLSDIELKVLQVK